MQLARKKVKYDHRFTIKQIDETFKRLLSDFPTEICLEVWKVIFKREFRLIDYVETIGLNSQLDSFIASVFDKSYIKMEFKAHNCYTLAIGNTTDYNLFLYSDTDPLLKLVSFISLKNLRIRLHISGHYHECIDSVFLKMINCSIEFETTGDCFQAIYSPIPSVVYEKITHLNVHWNSPFNVLLFKRMINIQVLKLYDTISDSTRLVKFTRLLPRSLEKLILYSREKISFLKIKSVTIEIIHRLHQERPGLDIVLDIEGYDFMGPLPGLSSENYPKGKWIETFKPINGLLKSLSVTLDSDTKSLDWIKSYPNLKTLSVHFSLYWNALNPPKYSNDYEALFVLDLKHENLVFLSLAHSQRNVDFNLSGLPNLKHISLDSLTSTRNITGIPNKVYDLSICKCGLLNPLHLPSHLRRLQVFAPYIEFTNLRDLKHLTELILDDGEMRISSIKFIQLENYSKIIQDSPTSLVSLHLKHFDYRQLTKCSISSYYIEWNKISFSAYSSNYVCFQLSYTGLTSCTFVIPLNGKTPDQIQSLLNSCCKKVNNYRMINDIVESLNPICMNLVYAEPYERLIDLNVFNLKSVQTLDITIGKDPQEFPKITIMLDETPCSLKNFNIKKVYPGNQEIELVVSPNSKNITLCGVLKYVDIINMSNK